jgi:predicted MFS family arabinose efflux permease
MNTIDQALTALRPARTRSLRTSFGLVVAAQILLFAGSNLPTPLFPIYEQHFGFGSATVTLLFGSYVAVLIPALLFVGTLSDRVGRRPLLVSGIAITVLSSVAFAAARSVGWLFAGEMIYGIGAALVMSCVSVAIRELHPRENVASAALAASVAMSAGLTIGPLISGLLASITPWPTTAPYLLDVVLAAVLARALVRIPETRPLVHEAAPRAKVIYVPPEIRVAFVGPAAVGALSFMAGGWLFALAPSFLHESLGIHITQPVVAGLFTALALFVNGITQVALRHHHSHAETTTGVAILIAGMAIIAASAIPASLAIAIVGAVLVGAGSGIAQMSAMHSVQHLAPIHARGSVMSTYVTLCYLALSVPVIIAGFAAEAFDLSTVTAWYVVALVAVSAVALVFLRSAHRTGALATPDR